MDNQRLFLFAILGFIVLMLWQSWQEQNRPAPVAPVAGSQTRSAPAPSADKGLPGAPVANSGTTTPQAVAAAPTLSQGQRVLVRTDLVEALIDTRGGDIRVLKLLKHPVAADKKEIPFSLLSEASPVFVAQSGLIGHGAGYPTHLSDYRVGATRYELKDGDEKVVVPLYFQGADGTRYTKTFTFHRDRYLVDVEFHIDNRSATPWNGFFYGQLRRSKAEKSGGFMALPTFAGGAIYTPTEHYEKIPFEDLDKQALQRDVENGWAAVMQHYFVASWWPEKTSSMRIYGKPLGNGEYIMGFSTRDALAVAPGSTGSIKAQFFAGPKETRRLAKLVTGMDLTVDYGWLTIISGPLFWLLTKIHLFLGNWGWSIIVLTILIKLAFFPLSAASYKSMAKLRHVQPKLESLKTRYGDDKQRMQQAMMELYKTEKINPLGGCLPILIQIPVFIALYWVLLESVEMRHAPFALWITDLSSQDPYYVLPLLMGATMFIQHHLNPSPMDPTQKKIMQFLPAIFTVFFLFFPSGLVLYWVVNNILSIAQQWQITRMIEGGKKV